MDYLPIIAEIIFITSSGVFSPGPLTFSVVSKGSSSGWKAGFLAAMGHATVELPLILLLFIGIGQLVKSLSRYISFIGGLFLVYFSVLQMKDSLRMTRDTSQASMNESKAKVLYRSPFLIGVILSAFNPFFLLWWATAGLKIVMDVLEVIPSLLLAIPFLYIFHVWMDFLWLSLIAHLSYKGKYVFGRYLGYVLLLFSILLLYYGVIFITKSIL